MSHEVWRKVTIPWASHFEVSSFGRVRNTRTKKLRKLTERKKDGRLVVSLSNGSAKHHTYLVHRLVNLAFHGSPKSDQESRHLDGDDKNNYFNNLKWGSSQENSDDMMEHGTASRGSARPDAKLSEADVISIRRLDKKRTWTHIRIAERFGVCRSVVTNIINRKTWRHVQ